MITSIQVWKKIQEYKKSKAIKENMMDPIDEPQPGAAPVAANPDGNNFPAQFGIDDEVAIVDSDGGYQYDATVVAVRFTKSKVFYDVISHYDARVQTEMDSVFVKPMDAMDIADILGTMDEAMDPARRERVDLRNAMRKASNTRGPYFGMFGTPNKWGTFTFVENESLWFQDGTMNYNGSGSPETMIARANQLLNPMGWEMKETGQRSVAVTKKTVPAA